VTKITGGGVAAHRRTYLLSPPKYYDFLIFN